MRPDPSRFAVFASTFSSARTEQATGQRAATLSARLPEDGERERGTRRRRGARGRRGGPGGSVTTGVDTGGAVAVGVGSLVGVAVGVGG